MFQLAAALLAPVLGAFMYVLLHDRPRRKRLFDGLMYLAVPVLVVWQVLPHAWAESGLWTIAVFLLGMVLPAEIERRSKSLAPHTDHVALLVGISGLSLHALLEGAALASPSASLSGAVILHRIPVGLAIWWLVRPRYGFRSASLGIGLILVGTLAGYIVGTRLVEDSFGGVDLYQVFVGGSLLHAVFHQGRHSHRHDED